MTISFGSYLSGLLATVLLSLYGCLALRSAKRSVYWDLRVLILLFTVAGARMLVPFNLPVNVSMYSKTLLIPVAKVLFYHIPHTSLFLVHLLLVCSLIISSILLIRQRHRLRLFRRHVETLALRNMQLTISLENHPLNNHPDRISAVYLNAPISPFVFGLGHPLIVLPKEFYSEAEQLQVLDHELTHIRQHDLLIKGVFAFLTFLFWWNPFMWILRNRLDDAIELSNDVSLYQHMEEQEKLAYASLLVKTASLSEEIDSNQVLALSTHADPILQRRVKEIIDQSSPQRARIALHLCVMLLITGTSFVITPEPDWISEDNAKDTFTLDEDRNTDGTYIIDHGDHYELYVEGESQGDFQHIVEDMRDIPVYKERDLPD